MKTVRIVASVLYQLTRMTAVLVILIGLYAAAVVLLYLLNPSAHPPMEVLANKTFQIFFPFTHAPFLLGDFTAAYLISNLFTLFFYGIFLGMLSEVLNAFRQERIFTRNGVTRLSRFYVLNLVVPFVFIALLLIFGRELMDMVRITLLHFVIGVFAFFMAAIFKHGVVLQEEQDLIF